MKRFIKSFLPPVLLNILKKMKSHCYGWRGDYQSWQEAKKASMGYDTDEILQKVRNSLLKVKRGESVYERDGVLFDKIEYSWPLLAGLMYAAARLHGALHVMDFGGSLGSTYFQNKIFLDGLRDVRWSIVEQKHFVDAGQNDFENERLRFYDDVNACIECEKPTILLMSSVLQYLENPYKTLDHLLEYEFELIVMDRTAFSTKHKDMLTVQKVPKNIYEASYPCWFFDEEKLYQYFSSKGYRVIEVFDSIDGSTVDYTFKGCILEKITC